MRLAVKFPVRKQFYCFKPGQYALYSSSNAISFFNNSPTDVRVQNINYSHNYPGEHFNCLIILLIL